MTDKPLIVLKKKLGPCLVARWLVRGSVTYMPTWNRIRNPLRFNANEMPQFTRYIENAYRNDIAVL